MIEEKLFRVQQRPEDVLIGFLFAFEGFVARLACGLLVEVGVSEFDFGGVGVAAERDVVEVGDFIVVRPRVLREGVGTAVAT